jgi:hypothetical protein
MWNIVKQMEGSYVETATFKSESIIEALQYAEDKFGSVFSIKEV